MSNVIPVDFAGRIVAQNAEQPATRIAPSEVETLAATMPATASLSQVVLLLRTGARDAGLALQQMRDGSTELIRLSTEMTQQTGALADQLGSVSTALDAFGNAVRKLHGARTSAIH
jgi:hypothetical protein